MLAIRGEGIAIHNTTGVLLDPDHVLGKGQNYNGVGVEMENSQGEAEDLTEVSEVLVDMNPMNV